MSNVRDATVGDVRAYTILAERPASELRVELTSVEEGRIEARWFHLAVDPHPLDLPLVKGDAEDHRWYLEEYLRLPGPGDRAREARMATWGERLYAALRPPDAPHPLAALLEPPRGHVRILPVERDGREVLVYRVGRLPFDRGIISRPQ